MLQENRWGDKTLEKFLNWTLSDHKTLSCDVCHGATVKTGHKES